MAISYNKSWKLQINEGMKKRNIPDAANMTSNTLAQMGKNEIVTHHVLVLVCNALQCNVGDIIEVLPDRSKNRMLSRVES